MEPNKIQKLTKNIMFKEARFSDITFNNFCLDSRKAQENDIFIALKSHTNTLQSTVKYILDVIDKVAFIISEVAIEDLIGIDLSIVEYKEKIYYIKDIRSYLGELIRNQLQNKQEQKLPRVIAVTGTNGKTTISQLIAQLMDGSDYVSAVMGTAGNGRLNNLQVASHTTEDVLSVHKFLYQIATDQLDILSLEASSHGLDQHRLQGLPIEVAIYTNLSRDHLDYHENMEQYAQAKSRLFDRNYFLELKYAIINLDDDYATIMLKKANESGIENIWTYTLDPTKQATFIAQKIEPSLKGTEIELITDFGTISITSPLLGRFNISNLIASIAGALALGMEFRNISELVKQLKSADGRMDRVASNTGCFIVDYAHTPDALVQVLTSLKDHCIGELWAVFGCGGDRDKGKRPLMAQAGMTYADRVVLTSDNPRSEDPNDILVHMQAGMTDEQYLKTHIEVNRQTAIGYAVKNAKKNDIVVIADRKSVV